MPVMPTTYQQLLEATIQHLQELKHRGTRFVEVAPETLAALARVPRPADQPRAIAPRAEVVSARPGIDTSPPSRSAEKPSAVSSTPVSISVSPVERQAKEQAMAELRVRALVWVKCLHLAASRKNVVFGVGDAASPLLSA